MSAYSRKYGILFLVDIVETSKTEFNVLVLSLIDDCQVILIQQTEKHL